MEQHRAPINELLAKYLRNECSPEERLKLLAHLENPENAGDVEAFMYQEADSLFRQNLKMDREISDRILSKLKSSIGEEGFQPEKTLKRSFIQRFSWRVAASIAGIIILAGLGFMLYKNRGPQTFATVEGQKSTILLSDGSRITLNDNSTVSFRMDDDSREVMLTGEAYFDVAHDKNRPFYVRTSDLEIKVLGTVFNVKSYHEDDRVETTLVSGKVVVRNMREDVEEAKVVELAPNEQVVYFKETARLEKAVTDVETNTSWRSGKLYFEDETAETIFAELEKYYGVKIAYDGRERDCRFSMNIDNEKIEDVMGFFEKTTTVKVTRLSNGYRLEGKLCEKP